MPSLDPGDPCHNIYMPVCHNIYIMYVTVRNHLVMLRGIVLLLFAGVCCASFFDFFQGQRHEERVLHNNPLEYEKAVLNAQCGGYICPGTNICVDAPKFCPCAFPSSQLRCFLPDGRHICISKPAGDFGGAYDDPATNWKVDAKDDDVRDCGWVSRKWSS